MNKLRKLGFDEAADVWVQRTEIKDSDGKVVDFKEAECDIAAGSMDSIYDAVKAFHDRFGLSQAVDDILDAVVENDEWSDKTYTITSERWLTDASQPLT
jgi:hypothetical protein